MIKVSALEDETHNDEHSQSCEPMESTSEPEAPKVELKAKRVSRNKKSVEQQQPPPQSSPPPPPSPEPVIVPTSQPAKMGRMTTCQNCGKELLEKTFRYYHQLKCKPKESTPLEHHNEAEQRPESIIVGFNFRKRSDVKQSKYSNLFTKAF